MTRPVPAARRRLLRESLSNQASLLVASEGLGALQARRLAELAGCSVGAIYNVFPDLDDLILEANSRTLRQIAEHEAKSLAELPETATPAARFTALALAYVDFAHAHENAWRALFEYQPAAGKAYPDWYVEAQSAAFSIIEQVISRIEPPAGNDAKRLGRALWAAVHGIVLTGMDGRLGSHSRQEIEAQIRLLVGAASRGLGFAT